MDEEAFYDGLEKVDLILEELDWDRPWYKDLEVAGRRDIAACHTPVNNPVETIPRKVASEELGFRVDLERLAEAFEQVIYEPEVFPAIIYYMDRPKVTSSSSTAGG